MNGEACFGYFYESDLVLARPTGTPFHCVAVSNRSTSGQLLAYVEFFGCWRMVVCLADEYAGADVHSVYALDPRSGDTIPLDVGLDLAREDVLATFAYERYSGVEAAFAPIIEAALAASYKREFDARTAEAVEAAFRASGAAEGDALTAEQIDKVVKSAMSQLTPLIEWRLRRPQSNPGPET